MPTALRNLIALVSAVALLLPSASAFAQEGGVTWEEAPATPDDPAPAEDAPAETSNVAPSAPAPANEYAETDPRALTDFEPALRPYGVWRNDPTYGQVWIPNAKVVGPDFAPYVTSGHWALTDDNQWIWVSNYPFGWVVFHYGRWVWIDTVGWAWIPGRRYAHAWVVWRVPEPGYYYVGWSPMPPDYIWVNGVAVGVGFGVYYTWAFCPSAYVFHPHVHGYVIHDHHHVHYVAAHTHRWRPPHGHSPYSGPPPKRAHVPASSIPKKHTPANPKAIAASRPSGGSSAQKLGPLPAGRTMQNPRGAPAPTMRRAPLPPSPVGGVRSAPSRLPSALPPPGARVAPSPPPPRGAAPPQYGPPPQRSAPPPQRSAPPPQRSAPARAAPPSRPSSPPPQRFSPPRASPPMRSAPPPMRSAPPSRGGGRGRR